MGRVMTAVVPPGGWRYPQQFNGKDRWIEGAGYEDLIKQITEFRISNQIVLGNPESDVDTYFCTRFPANCNRAVSQETQQASAPRSFRERVTQWAANRYQYAGTIQLEEQTEADRRAAICQGCPANQTWREGCPPCIESTDRTLLLIRQNHKPERAVLGCAIAGHDNTTAAFLPEKMLRHRNNYLSELPDFCWMKPLTPEA